MSTARSPQSAPPAVAAWIAGLRFDDIPAATVARVQDLLLDTLAVAIGAARVPASAIAAEFAGAQFGPGPAGAARLPFDGRPVSPAGAAWALATRIDNLDAHDGYQPAKGHAGVALVAALLALAQQQANAVHGRTALAALVAGYEIACRAGAALHATAGDYHSSGAWNALGVAALGCRLRGIEDPERIEAALGAAEYHAPRAPMMREVDAPSMLHDSSGWGALAGVTAVELAAAGFEASPAALPHDPSVAALWSDLGRAWLVERQYVKPHPVCFWAQPAIRAALALRAAHGLDPASIGRVRIDTFHEASRLAAGVPATTARAQYALAFPVACALQRGRVGPDEIAGSGLGDPAIHALTARIEVAERPEFSARFPEQRLAEVSLQLADGRSLASGTFQPRGVPDDPLDRAAIEDKLGVYAEGLWPAARQRELVRAVQSLHAPDATLAPLLRPCLGDGA
ncbi:MAG: MmgE/PrpD family protein [Halofilum sp. (in: g-proteobacteria)]|nr:MmgE/PrpD family protein [Halofilum sp. (in: g-proteobacteria)]